MTCLFTSFLRVIPCSRTERIHVARGLVGASVVSRVVAVNSSDITGGRSGQAASVHSFAKLRAVGTARLFEFHRPQSTNTNLEAWPSHTPSEQGFSWVI
ncbi:hypothetical protein AVEN_251400-1 [Araneus ventricosus]|uniref:Uncharacterized protein n=1 Tax=Araneus ventricosus TaxID=182803 RepID=A0A4Y2JU18_ARAVE|nr:hypothetical protein AVEN_251400-1 [Araneus ventricosus]